MTTSRLKSETETEDTMDPDINQGETYKKVIFEPIRIGPVSTLEEMDNKVLQFQNKKLEMKLQEYRGIENELQQRIEHLEKRQSRDKTAVSIMSRFWNNLNDNMKTKLLEFDDRCQTGVDQAKNDAVQTFLKVLSSSNEDETNEHLVNHVQMSASVLTLIIQAYDHILRRHDQAVIALKTLLDDENERLESRDINRDKLKTVEQDATTTLSEQKIAQNDCSKTIGYSLDNQINTDSCIRTMLNEIIEQIEQKYKDVNEKMSDDQWIKCIRKDIEENNVHLQNIINSLQIKCHESSKLEHRITEALKLKEREYDEWKRRIGDSEYENERLKSRKCKIEQHLGEAADTLEKLKVRECRNEKCDSSSSCGKKFEDLEEELELQRELALKRSQELESLRAKYQSYLDKAKELEKKCNDLPDDIVEESAEFKCLQSQYSVLYADTIHIKDQIEEYHAHIQTLNATFANKMEMTETEDLMTLRKLQSDLLQMQQVNSQLRREYQTLKIEFERHLIANEETAPLNKEMRHLLVRLQKHNKHLKHEAQRYKRKYKELNAELNSLTNHSYAESKFKIESEGGSSSDFDESDYTVDITDDLLGNNVKNESSGAMKSEKFDRINHSKIIAIKAEPEVRSTEKLRINHVNDTAAGPSKMCSKLIRKTGRNAIRESQELLGQTTSKLLPEELSELDDNDTMIEDEYVLDLRNQLKKEETEQKELKLLLDTYKGVNRDKREKLQLSIAEKKLKSDIDETRAQMRRILEIKRENRKKLADENALRKITYLEEQNFLLSRQINVHKQEEEALLSEMEVTNQAFEDMQEQNSRLIQQLREKDDANSKLMAERIKSNLLYKITREENESLQALSGATAKQLDSVTTVLNELEEKEQVYQTAINNVEKEMNLRQQAIELHRKKAMEYAYSTSELRQTLEKYLTDVKDAKLQLSENSSALDAANFKYNRLQEEASILQRQVKRMKKVEPSESPDVVLMEEIREYKEMLTCQSCKVRRKDAVLSKCFHVFCWECLRTRYETRQRKCPKCNATFGANDYHRLFFAN